MTLFQMSKVAQNWSKATLKPGTYYIVPHIGYIADGKRAPFVISVYSNRVRPVRRI